MQFISSSFKDLSEYNLLNGVYINYLRVKLYKELPMLLNKEFVTDLKSDVSLSNIKFFYFSYS